MRHLELFGLRCTYAGDIADRQDALARDTYGNADAIITNPPYTRELMHALIEHLQRIAPTWLLLEADWVYTKQAAPFMPSCSDVVAIGRLRWIEGTTMSSYENFAWYRFDARHRAGPIFHATGRCQGRRASVYVGNVASLTGRGDPIPGFAPTVVGNAPIAAA